jgi:HPt (histidine-containing phosphotransfer) domain-containing protein
MSTPVNLENLRDMTGGDPAFEQELFQVFLESAEECLTALQTLCETGKDMEWRTQAHALKGMCLNLGANKLGEMSANAQANYMSPPEQKTEMLAGLRAEFDAVKQFLQSQSVATG